MTEVCTIGFTKRSLRDFVETLKKAHVEKVIDTRLRPASQLSGWAKSQDLEFLLNTYEGIGYEHAPELAPTGEILDAYRKTRNWSEYATRFDTLMADRDMVHAFMARVNGAHVVALLCSEATPEQCHRRLLAEAIVDTIPGLSLRHL